MNKVVKNTPDLIKGDDQIQTANAADTAKAEKKRLRREKWGRIYKEYGYLFFAFAIPVLLMYLLYIAMEVYPYGNGSVLVLDLNGQYVYFYDALRAFVYGDASLLYSFGRSLGGEFLGIYAYYIASPLSYIVCLFPKSKTLEALLTIFLLKSGLCGLSFGFYLHKTREKVKRLPIIVFSVLYAMCAYCVVQQHNSMWIDAVMWLPLLTYGIEELIKKGHFRLFVVSLAVTMISNFYIGYMVCLYTLIYFFICYFRDNENGVNNPYGEKRHFIKSLVRIACYSVLALGIATCIWLSAYYALTFGKTSFTNPSWNMTTRFTLLELLTKFLPGSFDTVRPEGLPFIYCGVLTLFLVPVYFLSRKFTARQKIFSMIFIAIFFASFCFSPLDLIWHGFQHPNWLNYRYSFMLCFILLYLSYDAFCELAHAKTQWFFAIGMALCAFVVVAEQFTLPSYLNSNTKLDPFMTVWCSLALIAVYTVVLYLFRRNRANQVFKRSLALILLFFVCIETAVNGMCNVFSLDSDVVYSTYSSYNNMLKKARPVLEELRAIDDSFYRMEKTDVGKTNENMAMEIRGLSNSTSTLNASTIEFLNQMGYSSSSHWSKYHGGNLVNDSLLGLKYIMDGNSHLHHTELDFNRMLLEKYGKEVVSSEDYTVFENPYALSICYGVSNALITMNMDDFYNPYDRLNSLITAMLGESETVEVFVPVEAKNSTTNCETSSIAKHTKYTPSVSSRDAIVHYNYECPEDSVLYFYLPSEYPREVKMKVNGVDYGTFYGNETSRAMLIGEYEAGESVLVSLTLTTDNLYVKKAVPVIYKLDFSKLEEVMNRLKETQLIIDEDYTEDTLPGKVVSKKDNQLMLTTIPYDAGWIVTVDGERVETEEMIDSLLAFHVDAGEHEVVLKYRPKTFTLGLTASLFFLAIFVLLLVFVPKMKRPCFLLTGVPTEKEDESDTAPKKRAKDKETGENTKKNAKNSPKK